ncbi:MAG: flagellar biosynthesis protein FlhB [Desulfarculales bacterium]|jgi:flagellar biosynthetic protein FlhB|nr:flagellar biosynthesis protein FlhB [Desulfarculales bacterium]
MADNSAQEKTEKPTPRKRSKAREKGQVAKSAELAGIMVLMAGLVSFLLFGGFIYNQVRGFLSYMLANVAQQEISPQNILGMFQEWCYFLFVTVAPVFLFVVLAAVVFNVIQVGFMWAPARIKPDLNKLNPLSGFKRLFSKRIFFELFKNITKLVIVGSVSYITVAGEMTNLSRLGDTDTMATVIYLLDVCFKIFWRAVLAMLALALLDWAFQKYNFEKDLKMSKQEIKDEFKQIEGDPHVKARIRSLQRDAARKRMMSSVPQADVVITNPTHLAVALTYKPGDMDAPQVVAKGANLVAQKIKELAYEANIPVIEDKPLAQALYKSTEVGQSIPFELYEAVAGILAHIYRQNNRQHEMLDATGG